MKFIPDHCPECGEEPKGVVEVVQGLAGLQPDGKGGYEYKGGTDIWWENQAPDLAPDGKVRLQCCNRHEWYAEQRREAEQPAEEDPTKVVVFLNGGLVGALLADRPCRVMIIDQDIQGRDDAVQHLAYRDGEPFDAALYEEEAGVDPAAVDHYFRQNEPYEICECGRKPHLCETFDNPEAQHGDRR